MELQAWTLLRRYGVVFRRLLTRETVAAPWRDLTRVYRRLEARGEIRGGRFVSGMAGEQFALPDAVPVLREVRRTPPSGAIHAISTADPLNLAGIVTAGTRLRAAGRNRVAYRDGVPVAAFENQVFRALVPLDAADTAAAASALAGRPRLRLGSSGPIGQLARGHLVDQPDIVDLAQRELPLPPIVMGVSCCRLVARSGPTHHRRPLRERR